jgi:hypothetical protein
MSSAVTCVTFYLHLWRVERMLKRLKTCCPLAKCCCNYRKEKRDIWDTNSFNQKYTISFTSFLHTSCMWTINCDNEASTTVKRKRRSWKLTVFSRLSSVLSTLHCGVVSGNVINNNYSRIIILIQTCFHPKQVY